MEIEDFIYIQTNQVPKQSSVDGQDQISHSLVAVAAS